MSNFELIDKQIAFHREQIERLKSARAVLVELSANSQVTAKVATPSSSSKATPKAAPKAPNKKTASKPTKAKTVTSADKSNTNGAKPAGLSAPVVKQKILDVLNVDASPRNASSFIEKLELGDDRQKVYAALSDMQKKGTLAKDEEGNYSLPQPQ